MTAEIDAEFWRVLLAAWGCFGAGVMLWHWRSWANFAGLQNCSKLLLLLSPVLLSAFGYRSTEAVRTAELMARAVPVRHVGNEFEPVIADRDTITTQGGTRIEYVRTNYGAGRWGAAAVRVGDQQTGRGSGSSRPSTAATAHGVTGIVSLPLW
jgi:hypothetical protein